MPQSLVQEQACQVASCQTIQDPMTKLELSNTMFCERSRFVSSPIYQWRRRKPLLAMVHGVAAVDIGGPTVYGVVDRNEEMGLCVDWSTRGIGCDRGHYDGGWTDFWRKDH